MLTIVILAAGASSRLGSSKQLLIINQQTVIYRAARTACLLAEIFNLDKPLVVLGKDQAEVSQAVASLPVATVYNPRWQEGMGVSIAAAIEVLEDESSAVLLMTCDQLMLNVDNLSPLIKKWLLNPEQIIASSYKNTIGIPVIFPRQYFNELGQLNTDKGARQLLQKYNQDLLLFDLPEAAQDLDNKKDERLIRQLLQQGPD